MWFHQGADQGWEKGWNPRNLCLGTVPVRTSRLIAHKFHYGSGVYLGCFSSLGVLQKGSVNFGPCGFNHQYNPGDLLCIRWVPFILFLNPKKSVFGKWTWFLSVLPSLLPTPTLILKKVNEAMGVGFFRVHWPRSAWHKLGHEWNLWKTCERSHFFLWISQGKTHMEPHMPNTGKHVARSCHTAEKRTWASESDLPPGSCENLDKVTYIFQAFFGSYKRGENSLCFIQALEKLQKEGRKAFSTK